MRIIVGISGASGAVLGYELLNALRRQDHMEIHLIITEGAAKTFAWETELELAQVRALADFVYDNEDLAARISSGSFPTDGMVIVPCSMKTLAAIASGYTANLLTRAADVCLKENRKVVLVPRETPLGRVHLQNLKLAADWGCQILPPMLSFYHKPTTMEEQIQQIIGKILMQFHLVHEPFTPWEGTST